jgi:O-antigen ligase
MNISILIALAAVLAYACFERAGVLRNEWNMALIAVGVVAAIHFLIERRERIHRFDRLIVICPAVVLGIAALQLVPLPVAVVRILSPARVELLQALEPVAGRQPLVTLSAVPYATAQWLLSLAAFVAVFLLVRDLTARLRYSPWATVWPLLAIAGLEAALGVYQAYAEGGGAEATGTYNSRDHFAGLIEMVLPLAAMYAAAILQRDRQRHESPARPALQACGVMAIAALLLVGIVHSLSRMGFLSTLAALFVCGALALSARRWRMDYQVSVPFWRRLLAPALAGVAVIAGFIFLPTDPLIARFADFAHTEDISADTRAQLWRDTVPLIKDYPLFGCGFGAYESCFMKYKSVAPMNTADFAHNDYLQVLAELGVFAFAAGLIFVLRIMAGLAREVLYGASLDERYRATACLAAMVAMLCHSFVDFNMYVPSNAMVFAWIAGIGSANLVRNR